jgi:hypothetical protein
MKKYFVSLILSTFLGVLAFPVAAQAQGTTTVRVQAPLDAWQVRRAQTHQMIKVIEDSNVSQADRANAVRGFDARLTAAEKGELTPMETMELLRIFYVPKELQSKPPHFDMALRIVAMQATLGWYDALRFADASGRAEISTNEDFDMMAFGDSAQAFVQYMKDYPEQAAAAVKAGIQDAHAKIKANSLSYDIHWPASYGMLRMQCALQNAKTCETPKPRPASDWPALLDQADQMVSNFYRASKNK